MANNTGPVLPSFLMGPSQASTILSIPSKIVEHILLFCHPRDVACFSSTCRFGEDLVYRSADHYFWRQLFLLLFDDPHNALLPSFSDISSFDWKFELVRRMKAERAAFAADATDDRESTLETFISVMEEALPLSRAYSEPLPSLNLEWLDNILRNSHVLDAQSRCTPNKATLGDRLKACMALSLKQETDDNLQELYDIRTRSRCFVYDLRNYHSDNSWGPYFVNGSVNWTHVDFILNVVETNLREQHSERIPRPPIGLQATRAHSPRGITLARTGQVSKVIVPTPDANGCADRPSTRHLAAICLGMTGGPRDPSFFNDRGFREATRLIELKLHLIPEEQMRVQFPSVHPPYNHNPKYPPLYFSGSSRGASGLEAVVQGLVHMGRDCVPRWRFTSIHDGQPQWSSEGVQIGNIGSAMGIAGTWTAFNHGEGESQQSPSTHDCQFQYFPLAGDPVG
ncbi:hypothetical protein B0H10DRAFT_1963801 [Mycena sp. CBHHK59/15]|nr:hypothetical protein B0H10DRAFT_1963801 [Mycena sp. CBHHK59/15]